MLRQNRAQPRERIRELSGVARDAEFALAVFDKVICRDGDLSVKFKIVANTRRDQNSRASSGGIRIRRITICCSSAWTKRTSFCFACRTGKCIRSPCCTGASRATFGVSHDLRTGQWYEAKVIFRGDHFGFCSGTAAFRRRRRFAADPGKTGLWTRGGTVASFDDFRIDRKG